MVKRQRAEPGDGMLGMLVRQHGDDISDHELAGLADGLLTGGLETTTSMLALGAIVLLRDPELRRTLIADDAAVDPFVDELLRYLTVVQVAFPRIAARRTSPSGTAAIEAGDLVFCSLSAANRGGDPDLDRFDATRASPSAPGVRARHPPLRRRRAGPDGAAHRLPRAAAPLPRHRPRHRPRHAGVPQAVVRVRRRVAAGDALTRPHALAVVESLPREWPGVADPEELRDQLADWLSQYANAGTRRTLRLRPRAAGRVGRPGGEPRTRAPARPPPPRAPAPPRLVPLVRRARPRPRAATATHVKAWLHALDAAGARPRTRRRMLSTLSALLRPPRRDRGDRGQPGRAQPGPARARRERARRVADGPAHRRDRSPRCSPPPPGPPSAAGTPACTPPARSPSSRCSPSACASPRSPGWTAPTATAPAARTCCACWARAGCTARCTSPTSSATRSTPTSPSATASPATATPARRGRTGARSPPLLATRAGGRCSRIDLYAQLRRIAADAGPALDGVADRVHPHALRHAYVTIALEHDAPIQDVRADVGHATIATTQHYDRGLRRRSASAADVVAKALDLYKQ